MLTVDGVGSAKVGSWPVLTVDGVGGALTVACSCPATLDTRVAAGTEVSLCAAACAIRTGWSGAGSCWGAVGMVMLSVWRMQLATKFSPVPVPHANGTIRMRPTPQANTARLPP